MTQAPSRPLQGLKVVDFSTLLPGPIASLMLAEAGASVVKIERPGTGDDMRGYDPKFGDDGAIFVMLNRGKESLTIDLKDPAGKEQAYKLAAEADILIEQFRPGVMARLGLSYEELSRDNPRLIYCSISGYGQTGPKTGVAAHDLNYVAETGMLSLVTDADGAPSIPPTPFSDIAGGSYPAFMNIMLALFERTQTGRGKYLDISMSDNMFPFLYWVLASGFAGQWPRPNEALVTGGGPRYALYRTRDDRFIAAAPIEDKFWTNFCAILGLPESASREDVAAILRGDDAAAWMKKFEGRDVCCALVATVEEALADPQIAARGLFSRNVTTKNGKLPALPLPLVEPFRDPSLSAAAPPLA